MRVAGPLDLLEAERRPGFVDGYERGRLVALLARDLAQDIALDPPRGGGQVGGPAPGPAFGIRNPQEAVGPGRVDGSGAALPQLVDVLDEEQDRVVGAAWLRLGRDVAWAGPQQRGVAGGGVHHEDAAAGDETKLLGQGAEPGLVRPDGGQRPLRIEMAHGAQINKE